MYGIESEKTFINELTAEPTLCGTEYFATLQQIKGRRSVIGATVLYDGGIPVGVKSDWGVEGLDGSFHLGESSTIPVSDKDGGLTELSRRALVELNECQEAIGAVGGAVLNMSNNPLIARTQENVDRYSIPRPHSYAREVRGWDHSATIDASTQNSPSTSVSSFEAADAMNVILGLGSAFVALYANSPFYQGSVSGVQETRLRMWKQYFGSSTVPGDKYLFSAPPRPFRTLREYFTWIYDAPRSLYFVTDSPKPGTTEVPVIIDEEPSVMAFAHSEAMAGKTYPDNQSIIVRPKLRHIERNQFMQFYGARLRFAFTDGGVPPSEFLSAMEGKSTEVEQFMDDMTDCMYIEGRDPGTNFADAMFADTAPEAAASMYISPSALQAGLIANTTGSRKILDQFDWDTLVGLREEAIRSGMEAEYKGAKVKHLVELALEAAAEGIGVDNHWMLEYPLHVLRTGVNGAARALTKYEGTREATTAARIRTVLLASKAIPGASLLR